MRVRLVMRPGRSAGTAALLAGSLAALVGFPAVGLSHTADSGVTEAASPPSLEALQIPGALFGVLLIGCLIAFRFLRQSEYVERVRGFSRNARLLLVRGPFVGMSLGVWNLLFNLYLLALGFEPAFVAQMIAVNWLLHGLIVIPAGMLSDLFGRRVTFMFSYAANILSKVLLLSTLNPTWLLAFNAFSGATEGFHAIVGPPFLTEQSKPAERVHLFSLDSVLKTGSNFLGNLGAGVLPLLLAFTVGIGPGSGWAFRGALICSLPLMVGAFVPIYLIQEGWQRLSLRKWWSGVQSYRHIGMLALTSGLMSIGLGATAPFFNVYFASKLHASTENIGLVFSLGALAVAAATLLTPLLVKRWGKVNTIVWMRMSGIPFVLLMGMAEDLIWAAVFYLFVLILIGSIFPTLGMVDPVYQLFPMEIVQPAERGTTNGVIHAFKEFPMSIGSALAGFFIAKNVWFPTFWIAAICYAASSLIYLAYFRRLDVRAPAPEPPAAVAQPEEIA
ncbi:MAG: MFS transporter [Nitrospinota bacterium]